jgi:uncharacterized protein YndB with AHSA1/START domain
MQEGMNELEREKEVVISKLIPVARETVWRAWTEGPMIARWWGPNGVTIPEATLDPRVGGRMRIVMLAGPELGPLAGQHWPMEGQIEEWVEPERLVFTNNAIDEAGNVLLSGMTIVEFKQEEAGTLMTVVARAKGTGDQAAQMLGGMEAGWNQQIDKLIAFVSAPLA